MIIRKPDLRAPSGAAATKEGGIMVVWDRRAAESSRGASFRPEERSAQNGLTITRITTPMKISVGTSFIIL